MNVDAFSQHIEKLYSKIQALLQCNEIKANSQEEIITEAFEELHTAMEQLLTASQELKVTRTALEKERQRYQDLFEFAPDGYLVTNAVGTIQEANHAAATLLGVHQKYLVGKPLIVFIAQQDRQSFSLQLKNFQELLNWEINLQPRGGEPFPAMIKASAVYDLQKKQIGWHWLLCNITERKQVEKMLHQAYEELEIRVAERTAELVKANQKLLTEITERKRVESQLLYLAFHDALTGLPNRAAFMNRLRRAIDYAKRHSDYLFAVLFIDLDRFKLINDSLGHIKGDQFLLAIANKLEICIRSIDTVARLGGDEFTILLEGIQDVSDAIKAVERIQQELALPFELEGQEMFTTASIGIALSSTVDYEQPEELLRDADTAMYRAKVLGRARYELFNSDMYAKVLAKLQLETELRRAIEHLEFRVFYQPIVSLTKGSILGFEALLRWQHPERGLLNPADFIPLAEETGLIFSIGSWVLDEACRQMQAWRMCHHSNLLEKISVNLSLKQFSQPNLIEQIGQVLHSTGLDAATLVLEITESVIVENSDKTTAALLQLREMGIELSIDDFGTGYSSLGRLYNFPISVLKIDPSFISLMSVNSKDLEIIEIIITVAHKLGVDVLAEGVETKEQLALLRKLNCEYAQGNFFSVPLNSSAAEALIMTNPRW
ncbi:diguanylate cyclase/phosphodiesterase with PAS/PAC and GAF sensor(s) [Nostoc commune NIES-4072]|uniref:Diguanylate cyclase/phosphodiesterase with PAS/PAC and GAF sensor(S) n=1 Tax=Nostoc commune NIES-4072 TaxID=2005467 RepID=A0A2R5FM61_NOSCO|nr:GGDEF and EAL domain-containing protein [Nostoc commune]BBD69898.1 diguanylate cyclase/phosphodiesterase with PAS/PAC and GAF sensor(s) [Nostoc commune HK-02]GBG19099.1 diguanylate cyclase/phosphodiesterase with PAS/PAC and GAF sensor(s) [Nostoc commune NIES-4072]